MDENNRVQSIDRAINILKCFSVKKKQLKLTEISEELGLNKSTVHGIINTLKFHGLISQNEENQKYSLGLFLLELGSIVSSSMDVREVASPILNRVCMELEETVHLATLNNPDVIYIDKQESNQSMRIYTTIGARNPAYCTGVGKVMLAFEETEILEGFPDRLEKFTENTITDKRDLLNEFEKIRKMGYCIDNEEFTEGLICVAAPVFDNSGKVRYSISVSGPTIRMDKIKQERAVHLMKEAAYEISYKLGYRK